MLAKTKLNIIEVLISKALMDSYSSHDEFVPVNNALGEYNDIKEEIKNLKALTVRQGLQNNVILLFKSVGKIQKIKTPKLL